MTQKEISSGPVHKMPSDLRKVLTSDKAALTAWEGITPLARNEWICWVTFVKQDGTRKEHVKRTISELKEAVYLLAYTLSTFFIIMLLVVIVLTRSW